MTSLLAWSLYRHRGVMRAVGPQVCNGVAVYSRPAERRTRNANHVLVLKFLESFSSLILNVKFSFQELFKCLI